MTATLTATEPRVRDLLAAAGIDLVIAVPCKYVANLLTQIGQDDRFQLVYPSREEEGLGIAAGAFLAGRKPLLVVQNSGLGTLLNAHCSLNQFYGLPLGFIVTHRGDELEKVPAQIPMGQVTEGLLDLMKVECVPLRDPSDLSALEGGLRRYAGQGRSVAFLSKKSFWTV